MDDRRKLLENYVSDLKDGMSQMDDYIPKNQSTYNRALDARGLAQDALANEVLKNTNISVPNKGVAPAKMEDFLNRVVQERYPEFKDPNISVKDLSKLDANGLHYGGKIDVHNKLNPLESLSTALHEAGHKYDHDILGRGIGETLEEGMKNVRGQDLVKHADPMDVYEALAKGHHAQIPKLREGSMGLGALKSMLKTGTFKALPIIGGAAAIGAALQSPDASAGVADYLIPGGLDSAGSVNDEKEMLNDVNARNNYKNSDARRDALKKLTGK